MKTQQFALLAFVVAFVSAVAAFDETTVCPDTELTKLAPLALDANIAKCQNESSYEMLPPVGYPTDVQRVLMCDSVACFTLINEIKSLNVSDCLLVVGDAQFNVKKFVSEFEPSCYH